MRTLPPRRGGRTVGEKVSVTLSENCQMSQRWLKPSMPRRASGSRYSGSNTTTLSSSLTTPACRGMPNFSGKSLTIWAMGRISNMVGSFPYPIAFSVLREMPFTSMWKKMLHQMELVRS